MKTGFYVILAVIAISCDGSNHSKGDEKELNLPISNDISSVKGEIDVDLSKVSYSLGQIIRGKLKRQGITDLIEDEFINSFAKVRSSSAIKLQEVNKKLNDIKQSQGKYPNARRELSRYIGYYYGLTEGRGEFLNDMDVVMFANGLKDHNIGVNFLNLNCDSLFSSEKNKYNKFTGKQFLEENKKRKGVITTTSGLQYEMIVEGSGDFPSENSDVTVHYEGELVSGEVFDSSLERGSPISFNLQDVIHGWKEGLQLMRKGSKYKLYLPYELGYGGAATGKIPAYSTLVFEVQLIDF